MNLFKVSSSNHKSSINIEISLKKNKHINIGWDQLSPSSVNYDKNIIKSNS